MSNFPDPVTLLPVEQYEALRRARLAEMGLTITAADARMDAACLNFDEFLRRWVSSFPPEHAQAIFEILSDRAAELAQEIYE